MARDKDQAASSGTEDGDDEDASRVVAAVHGDPVREILTSQVVPGLVDKHREPLHSPEHRHRLLATTWQVARTVPAYELPNVSGFSILPRNHDKRSRSTKQNLRRPRERRPDPCHHALLVQLSQSPFMCAGTSYRSPAKAGVLAILHLPTSDQSVVDGLQLEWRLQAGEAFAK